MQLPAHHNLDSQTKTAAKPPDGNEGSAASFNDTSNTTIDISRVPALVSRYQIVVCLRCRFLLQSTACFRGSLRVLKQQGGSERASGCMKKGQRTTKRTSAKGQRACKAASWLLITIEAAQKAAEHEEEMQEEREKYATEAERNRKRREARDEQKPRGCAGRQRSFPPHRRETTCTRHRFVILLPYRLRPLRARVRAVWVC